MTDLVGQGDVRHGGRDVFAVIQKCYDPGVQAFQTAPVMLRKKQREIKFSVCRRLSDAIVVLYFMRRTGTGQPVRAGKTSVCW